MKKVQKVRRKNNFKNKLLLAAIIAGTAGITYTIYELSKIAKIEDIFDLENDFD